MAQRHRDKDTLVTNIYDPNFTLGNSIVFGNNSSKWWLPLTQQIGNKLAGWWFISNSSTNQINNKIPSGDPALIQGDAFKGDGTAKSSYGKRFQYFIPGYEEFVLSWEVILDTITATYAVILSDYNLVNKSRIQFNNSSLYIYDNDGDEIHWTVTGLVTDGHHTFELRGSIGSISLYIDGVIVDSPKTATSLSVVHIGDALKDNSGNGLPSWCTIFNIILQKKDEALLIAHKGDITGQYAADHTGWNDTALISLNPDYIVANGDLQEVDTDPDTSLIATTLNGLSSFVNADQFFSGVGNHDLDGFGSDALDDFKTYLGITGKSYYSVVLGEAEFFFYDCYLKLDETGWEYNPEIYGRSVSDYQNSTQGQWLLNAISASTATWKIVMIHNHLYSSNSVGTDLTGMRWDWAALGVDLILEGHGHCYERKIYPTGSGNVPAIMMGMGGTSLYANGIDPDPTTVVILTNLNTPELGNGGGVGELHITRNYLYYIFDSANIGVPNRFLDELLIGKNTFSVSETFDEFMNIPCCNLSTSNNYLWETTLNERHLTITDLTANNIVTQDYFSYNHLKSFTQTFQFMRSAFSRLDTNTALDGLTQWTIAMRIYGLTDADGQLLFSDETYDRSMAKYRAGVGFSYRDSLAHEFFFAGHNQWQVLTGYHSIVFYSNGTNVYLVIDGVAISSVTPDTVIARVCNMAYVIDAFVWDIRLWQSNVGSAEALKYHNNTMSVTPNHRYLSKKLSGNDEIGTTNFTVTGTVNNVGIPALTDKSEDVIGSVLLYPQSGFNFIPGTKVKLPESTIVITAAENISGNDWFDIGNNANAIRVEDIVNETKEQYIDLVDRDNLTLVKDGEIITDEEDLLIKSETHN